MAFSSDSGDAMSRNAIYVDVGTVPYSVPEGRVLMHNHVQRRRKALCRSDPEMPPGNPCLPSPRRLGTCGAKGSCDPGFRTRPHRDRHQCWRHVMPAMHMEAPCPNSGPLGNLVGDRWLCFCR